MSWNGSGAVMRLMIYDSMENSPVGWAWKIGAILFWILRRFHKIHGATSWEGALDWALKVSDGKTINELHFWGHGRWGQAFINGKHLGVWAVQRKDSSTHSKLLAFASRLTKDSLVWFRTCATIGNASGHEFAREFSRFFGCRVAGNTFNIGFWHSGLHSLLPDAEPSWPLKEGVSNPGTDHEEQASSGRKKPHTILFLRSHLPGGW